MDRHVIHITRRERGSERVFRRLMAGLAIVFLAGAITVNRGLMLPCFLMAASYYLYRAMSKRQYEYILENGNMAIDRLTDYGRHTRHLFALKDVELLTRPDDPLALPYKKGGSIPVRKYDYTSYADGVAWYTMIVTEDGKRIKLLLDLDDRAIAMIRRENRTAVHI